MKKLIQIATILCITIFIVGCKEEKKKTEEVNHTQHKMEEKSKPTKKKVLSPHKSAMSMIGDAHVHIDYSSPGARGRIVLGGLLAYGQIWQAGAHNATWLETNKDLTIDGKTLKAGKYGVFTIPSKEEWVLIFNSNWNQHGKDDYDQKDDVLRFNVKPVISDDITEHLEYKVKKVSDTEGSISLAWEKVSLNFSFQVNQ